MSVVLNSLSPQPATNTFFDNNALTTMPDNWAVDGVVLPYGPCSQPSLEKLVVCSPDDPFVYTDAVSVSSKEFKPFRLRQILTCNPAQWVNEQDKFFKILGDSFVASAHIGMAKAFWDGGTTWEGLVDTPNAAVVSPGLSISAALGILMQQMASTGSGSGGTIHMTPWLANAAVRKNLVYRRGQRLFTVVGDHLVIADGGYSGNGPADPATATKQYIYATGPVYYYIGGLNWSAGFDIAKYMHRHANRLVVPVEADAIFYFDPCTWFSVAVDLSCESGCDCD